MMQTQCGVGTLVKLIRVLNAATKWKDDFSHLLSQVWCAMRTPCVRCAHFLYCAVLETHILWYWGHHCCLVPGG